MYGFDENYPRERGYCDPSDENHENHVWTGDFNCGSFGLGRDGWYVPSGWHSRIDFGSAARSVELDNPEWRRVKSWVGVPKNRTLLAFRIEERYSGDFHFLLRVGGKWWHKMGWTAIAPVRFAVTRAWRCGYHLYNSEIAWFVRVDED